MVAGRLRIQFANCIPENHHGRSAVFLTRGSRITAANRQALTAPGKLAARPADSEPSRLGAEWHDDSVKNCL